MNITSYSVELIKDPFGILTGRRYEFLLDIDVPDDDELHHENGVYVRVIYRVEEARQDIVIYELFEKTTDKYIDIELEDEETEQIAAFCKEHYGLADQ